MKNNNTFYRGVFFLLVLVIACLVFMFVSGCQVTKLRKEKNTDSTSVRTQDSTHLKKEEVGKRTDSTWWWEKITFALANKKDSPVNNITVPVNNYYPIEVIRGGGTLSKQELQRILDSMAQSKKDTTTVSSSSSESSSKTKVLNMLQLIGIGIGISIVTAVLSRLKIGFK